MLLYCFLAAKDIPNIAGKSKYIFLTPVPFYKIKLFSMFFKFPPAWKYGWPRTIFHFFLNFTTPYTVGACSDDIKLNTFVKCWCCIKNVPIYFFCPVWLCYKVLIQVLKKSWFQLLSISRVQIILSKINYRL